MNIINAGLLNFSALDDAFKKPEVYTKSTSKFWDDDYIAKQMLEFHLNPSVEAASKKASTIQAETKFIIKSTSMKNKDVLDLGCGPGLYVAEFAKSARSVLGIDLSQNSIDYANDTVASKYTNVRFKRMNYLSLEDKEAFDIATLIFYDFGALDFHDQRLLLQKIHEALRPGGLLVFDVLSDQAEHPESFSISFNSKSFWSPEPTMEAHRKMVYTDPLVRGDQYTLISETGELRIIRVYDRLFSKQEITDLLEEAGFDVVTLVNDLSGTPFSSDSKTMGIIAKKR